MLRVPGFQRRSWLREGGVHPDGLFPGPHLPRSRPIDPWHAASPACGNAFLTVGYSVSRAAAEHLRRHGLPIRAPADWPCDVTRIPAADTMPRLVLHPDPAAMQAQSTLSSARGKNDVSNYDPNRHFAKGMRRFVTPASWRRFIVKRLSVVRSPGFAPAEDEVPWQPS